MAEICLAPPGGGAILYNVLSGADSPPEKDSLLRLEVNKGINQSINNVIFVSKYFSIGDTVTKQKYYH